MWSFGGGGTHGGKREVLKAAAGQRHPLDVVK